MTKQARNEINEWFDLTGENASLLAEAERVGCTVVDGLGMLIYQALPGFERWFGQRPEVDDATRAAIL